MTSMKTDDQVKAFLRAKTHQQIICDLTVGREDNDLPPRDDVFINAFISDNVAKIDSLVDELLRFMHKENMTCDDVENGLIVEEMGEQGIVTYDESDDESDDK